jgi:hypothetical protein
VPPSSAGSGLGFTGGVPSNKENNNSKKQGHEGSFIISTASTPAGHLPSTHGPSNVTTTTTNIPSSAGMGTSQALAKMTLKAREFGKELTNAGSTATGGNVHQYHNGNIVGPNNTSVGNGHFSSTLHPQTVKNSEHAHHH